MEPPVPPGERVCSNMATTEMHRGSGAIDWFYSMVRNGGAWDYKQRGRQYQDFGNYNYGATGKAHGLPDWVLLRAAGWAQSRAGTSDPFMAVGGRRRPMVTILLISSRLNLESTKIHSVLMFGLVIFLVSCS